MSSISRSGRSLGGGNGNPLQYSCLENTMDTGAWWPKTIGLHSQTQLKRQHIKVEHSQMGKPYLKGYNTDVYGFEQSLMPLLKPNHIHALILGTGGASKAVAYVLDKHKIDYKFVSRQSNGENILSYSDVDSSLLADYHLVINATPQGMYPDVDQCPDIDYEGLTPMHLCYDLVYNPSETLFMAKSMQQGTTVKNGMQMLRLQAEKSWEIWNIM